MKFEQHIKEIENPEFQIQFVALSGYSVLKLVLEEHEYVRSLVADLSNGEVQIEEVYERILCLLPRVEKEVKQSNDGSIVVYLNCLSKFDLALAYEASVRIQNSEGLFWSRRMARTLVERYWEKQISESMDSSSSAGTSTLYYEDSSYLAFDSRSFARVSNMTVTDNNGYPDCSVELSMVS